MFKNAILDHCRKDKKSKEKKNCLQFFPEIIIDEFLDFAMLIYILKEIILDKVFCKLLCSVSNTSESSASFCDYLIFHACLI